MKRTTRRFAGAAVTLVMGAMGCQPAAHTQGASSQAPAPAAPGDSPRRDEAVYSAFGAYAPLPDWSGWCGLQVDGQACAAPLTKAVQKSSQSAASRPTVRRHGWHLWPSIWSPIEPEAGQERNDALTQRTNLYGTSGCWSQFSDGVPACSGVYPIWLTWPNTGRPHSSRPSTAGSVRAPATPKTNSPQTSAPASPPTRRAKTLRNLRSSYAGAPTPSDPNPTQVETVNTPSPVYSLPPLVLSKQCGMTVEEAKRRLDQKLYLEIVEACNRAGAAGVFCPPAGDAPPAICDGTAFVNQGDVMIATESLSLEGYEDIQRNQLYSATTLNTMYTEQTGRVSEMIGRRFISTKHMFWPVKGCKPGVSVGQKGCRVRYGALPQWVPKNFRQYSYATNADYLGYEKWQSVVAIDTCESSSGACTPGSEAALVLDYVSGAAPIITKNPPVYPAKAFVHLQISAEALQHRFSATDRALLDQAMIWAYGDASLGFEAGDFLVVAAMHVNTKEIPSWAFQSVWWSPMDDSPADCPLSDYDHCFGQAAGYAATVPGSAQPNPFSGLTPSDLSEIDRRVGTAWRDHYLMTDSYGINYEIDGAPVKVDNYFAGKAPKWATEGPSGAKLDLLPVSANVYIEPVIHPLGTNCQNCHRRAGSPGAACTDGEYAGGCGRSGYQTAQCADLLGDYGAPSQDPCMTAPWAWHSSAGNACRQTGGTSCNGADPFPVLDTDWIWIIADNHVQQR